jgi:polar amino acid transport system ATP-binding protein
MEIRQRHTISSFNHFHKKYYYIELAIAASGEVEQFGRLEAPLLQLRGVALSMLFSPMQGQLPAASVSERRFRTKSGADMTFSQQSQPFISLRGVRKSFGSLEVLRGIDINIRKGEVVAIIGPSGSGKSTLLRTINGLTPISEGSIRVGDIEVNDPKLDEIKLRHRVGMVFQQYNLFPHWNVLQNVMQAPIQVLKQPRREVEARAHKLLSEMRLPEKADCYPGELSGGQQQRVAIARALCMEPEVILFDEVTAALDPEMVKEVLAAVRKVAEDGMTCILVTHEMGFAREAADHVYFTDKGVIVEHGPPSDFFTRASNPRTKEFLSQDL